MGALNQRRARVACGTPQRHGVAAGLVPGVELFDLIEEAGAHTVGLVDEPHGDYAVKSHRVTNVADSVPLWVAETPDNIQGRLTRAHTQEVLLPRVGFHADADSRVVALAHRSVLLQRVYVDAAAVWRVGDAVSVPFHEVEECLCVTGNIFHALPFAACCVGLLKRADEVGRVAVHARPCFAALGYERAQVVARDGVISRVLAMFLAFPLSFWRHFLRCSHVGARCLAAPQSAHTVK